MDWPKHKKLCKSFEKIPLVRDPLNDRKAWESHLLSCTSLIPEMSSQSAHIWMYQPHCQSCYTQEALTPCPLCFGVACCKREKCVSEFSERHDASCCELYRVRVAAYVMALQQDDWLRVSCCTRSDAANPPMELPENWAAYFSLKSKDFVVPFQLLQLPPVVAQLTDSLSGVMTTLLCLKQLRAEFGVKPFADKGKGRRVTTVHFIGADLEELLGADVIIEEFLHWIPECTVLDVVFVGPALPGRPGENGLRQRAGSRMCRDCSSRGCECYITCVNTLYHSAVDQNLVNPNPTIAVCLNSGIHETAENGTFGSTWGPTLRLMRDRNIPVVLTAYTELEMADDVKELALIWASNSMADVSTRPTRNPYRGLFPLVDVFRDNEFFYTSHYYTLIKGHAHASK